MGLNIESYFKENQRMLRDCGQQHSTECGWCTPGSLASELDAKRFAPLTAADEGDLIYRLTGNLRAVKIESTVCYLGIDIDDALEIAKS
jgi:xanthine dehydrogenase iron-sulfur cluster and FAD-binding subunit A